MIFSVTLMKIWMMNIIVSKLKKQPQLIKENLEWMIVLYLKEWVLLVISALEMEYLIKQMQSCHLVPLK